MVMSEYWSLTLLACMNNQNSGTGNTVCSYHTGTVALYIMIDLKRQTSYGGEVKIYLCCMFQTKL